MDPEQQGNVQADRKEQHSSDVSLPKAVVKRLVKAKLAEMSRGEKGELQISRQVLEDHHHLPDGFVYRSLWQAFALRCCHPAKGTPRVCVQATHMHTRKYTCVRTASTLTLDAHSDALLAFAESTKVFISYISSTSNDIAKEAKRLTISAEDVHKALEDCEFSEFSRMLEWRLSGQCAWFEWAGPIVLACLEQPELPLMHCFLPSEQDS